MPTTLERRYASPARPVRRPVRRRRTKKRGQALVEFALLLPVMMLVLLIAVDFGRLFSAYVSDVNAAREGAAYGAIHAADNGYSGTTYGDGITAAAIAQANAQGLSGGGPYTVTYTCHAASAPTISVDCGAASNYAGGTGNVVEVTVTQNFNFITPFIGNIFGGALNLTTTAVAPLLNPLVVTALTVTPVALASIVISPATASITTNATQAYTAAGYDANSNLIGDVTSATTFAITGVGTCSTAVCGSLVAGSYTVTGTDSGFTSTAALTVTPGTCGPITVHISPTNPSSHGQQTSLTETFTATVTGGTPTSWEWNFGDGFTSTAQNPAAHTFRYTLAVNDQGHPTTQQDWTVSLVAKTAAGCSGTGTTTVTVGK